MLYEDHLTKGETEQARKAYLDMQQLYMKGLKLGYREMPLEMYQSWLLSIKEQKDKYTNIEIKRTFNPNSHE